jgi:phosphoribosylformylglycinamidine cyclo-ligase
MRERDDAEMNLAGAGVRRGGVDELLATIAPQLRATDPEARTLGLPGFCGAIEVGDGGALLATTDGVGSKRVLMRDRLGDLGRDLVAYNVNDLAAVGAQPLAFLDYLSCGRLDVDAARRLITGMAAACQEARCVLLGGETAEHPGVQADEDFDLAGFAVGLARREDLVDGTAARAGEAVIGIGSSGPHASGFSLIRHAFAASAEEVPEEFLAATPTLNRVIEGVRRRVPVTSLAHICDGGLTENVVRGLPEGLGVVLRAGRLPRPAWVEKLKALGCREDDLRAAVNVGIAFTLTVPPACVGAALASLEAARRSAWTIGEVVPHRSGPRVLYEE